MKSLSLSDLQLLNWGIGKVYSLSNPDSFGVDTLSIIHQLVPGDTPLLQQTNRRIRFVEMPPLIDNNRDLSQVKSLMTDQPEDWLSKVSGDQIQADLIQSGFILDYVSHSCTERDRLMLTMIRPHLSLAYENIQCYKKMKQELGSLQRFASYLGLMIVDPKGCVKQATAQTIAWLETYFPTLTNPDRLPDRLWAWVSCQVESSSRTADIAPAYSPLYIEQNTSRLVIRLVIEADRNQYLLFLEEQTKSGLKSLELLGLSHRETEVLELILKGKDNKAIATELRVGTSTIRKHLENLYRKLRVQSRTEAIAFVLQQLGVLS